MTTGDVRAAVASLESALRSLKFASPTFDASAAEAGSPAPLLHALDHLMMRCSKHVTLLVSQEGLQLHGKSDLRFVEGVFKFARDVLGIRPPLTPAQFLTEGFAERKVLLVLSIAKACKEVHNAGARKERLAAPKAQHTEQRLCAPAAAAARAEVQQGQAARRRINGGRSIGIPLPPPPHVRVVSEHFKPPAADSLSEAAAEELSEEMPHVPTSAGDGESQSASDGTGATVTPTSVVTAAAGADCQQHSKQQQAVAAPGLPPSPAPSSIEQPRPLPPSLLLAQRQADSNDSGSGGNRWAQTGPSGQQEVTAASAAAGCVQVCSHPQLQAPALLPPQVQPMLQVQLAQHGALQLPLSSWQREQQLPPPQQAAGAQQAGTAGDLLRPVCPAAQPIPQMALEGRSSATSSGEQQQTWGLMRDLQLRLRMAEDACTATRQEAQLAQGYLQARVTVLEGRVRFLEGGYELSRLPQHQLQLAHDLQSGQASHIIPLAWGAANSQPAGMAARLPAASSEAPALGVAAFPGREQWAPWATQQSEQIVGIGLTPLEYRQHMGATVSGSSTGWSSLPAGPAAAEPSSNGTCQRATPAAPASPLEPAVIDAMPAACGYGSTVELIGCMQARFSEARHYLLSVQSLRQTSSSKGQAAGREGSIGWEAGVV